MIPSFLSSLFAPCMTHSNWKKLGACWRCLSSQHETDLYLTNVRRSLKRGSSLIWVVSSTKFPLFKRIYFCSFKWKSWKVNIQVVRKDYSNLFQLWLASVLWNFRTLESLLAFNTLCKMFQCECNPAQIQVLNAPVFVKTS